MVNFFTITILISDFFMLANNKIPLLWKQVSVLYSCLITSLMKYLYSLHGNF